MEKFKKKKVTKWIKKKPKVKNKKVKNKKSEEKKAWAKKSSKKLSTLIFAQIFRISLWISQKYTFGAFECVVCVWNYLANDEFWPPEP